MTKLEELENRRLGILMSDDFAMTNGSLTKVDAEITAERIRLLNDIKNPGEAEQRRVIERGTRLRIYDPSDPNRPWNFGKVCNVYPTGVTIEDKWGVLWSAPFGPRIRMVRDATLYHNDLFGPLP